MNICSYVGIPYSLRPIDGCVNCWGLVALIYINEIKFNIPIFKSSSFSGISNAFTAAFASGEHGFTKVDQCMNFDVAVFISESGEYHCGVMYSGSVLHATNKKGQSVYETLAIASEGFDRVEFWRL